MKNGPLRFVSMADRALDVCQFEYRGENLVLRRTITSVYGRLSITVEPFLNNFEVQKPQKAASEAKAECARSFRLI